METLKTVWRDALTMESALLMRLLARVLRSAGARMEVHVVTWEEGETWTSPDPHRALRSL
jgi:hypothetical protein